MKNQPDVQKQKTKQVDSNGKKISVPMDTSIHFTQSTMKEPSPVKPPKPEKKETTVFQPEKTTIEETID